MNDKKKTSKLIMQIFLFSALLSCLFFLQSCGKTDRNAFADLEAEKEVEEFGEFNWPKSDIAALIPIPKSNIGRVEWEASYGFVLYVAETSKEDYDAYVDDCWDRGFTIDYSRGNDYFWADNENGYKVTVRFEENNVMFVRMDDPPDEFQPEDSRVQDVDEHNEDNQELSPPTEMIDDKEPSSLPDNGMRLEFQEAMDGYEAFFDEYVAFMQKYNSSGDTIAMLADYLDYMSKYADTMSKIGEISEDELSSEELEYYTATMSRITQKLLEITG